MFKIIWPSDILRGRYITISCKHLVFRIKKVEIYFVTWHSTLKAHTTMRKKSSWNHYFSCLMQYLYHDIFNIAKGNVFEKCIFVSTEHTSICFAIWALVSCENDVVYKKYELSTENDTSKLYYTRSKKVW